VADRRLIAILQAEGFTVINPETARTQARPFSGVRIFYADVHAGRRLWPQHLGAGPAPPRCAAPGSKGSGFSPSGEGLTPVVTVVVNIRDYGLKPPLHPIVDEIDIHARAGILTA
jgi:hypothetical protein